MGRIIGLIGCTCLVIVALRLTNLQYADRTLKGGEDRVHVAGQLSPREHYKLGKEMYLRGKYRDAVGHLDAAMAAKLVLTGTERRQAEEYLTRSRSRLQARADGTVVRAQSEAAWDQDPAEESPQGVPAHMAEVARGRVDKLMDQAMAALKRGDRAEAIKLATLANSFAQDAKITFGRKEMTPAALLAQLRPVAQANATAPDWADDDVSVGSAVKTAAGRKVQQVGAESFDDVGPGQQVRSASTQPASTRDQAIALVTQARQDLKAGRYDEARRKALAADELDVTYDVFDDRPELVLNDVDRLTNTATLAGATRHQEAAPVAAADGQQRTAAKNSKKQQAVRLLELARQDIANGNLEAAQAKADQAEQLNVAYGLFDDTPELVQSDVAARRAAEGIAETKVPSTETAPAAKPQAQALLAKARQALSEDRLDEARQLAIEAERLKAPYDLFDDRPDLVLADVARSAKRGPTTPGTPVGDAGPSETATQTANVNSAAARQNMSPAQQQATELLRQARQLTKAGRYDEAREKVAEAEGMNVAFPVFADRPDLVLADLEAKLGNANVASNGRGSREAIETASGFDSAPTEANPFAQGNSSRSVGRNLSSVTQADSINVVNPNGASAGELYSQGMKELNRGNRQAAYSAFLAAHQTGQKLDYVKAQRLQDYLRELAPRTSRTGIQLANNTQIGDGDVDTLPGDDQPAPLDAAAQEQMVRYDRLRSDVLNAVFKAERMKATDPEAALTLIDQTMARVEASELPEASAASLMKNLNKTRSGLQSEIVRQQPNLEMKHRNEEVKKDVERVVQNNIRIEQEFAKLVEEFNDLFKQQRFAEAEVVAKKAKELNPKDPTAETLFWKARFGRRIASNSELQNNKEETFWKSLDDVEQTVVHNITDENPIDFGKKWKDISERRKGRYRADSRKRGEKELEIESALSKRISLHEDQVPLAEVIKKIQAIAAINIVLDMQGLEEEGASSNSLVSIEVDSIQVKSALNLILNPNNLAYTVENEVLKITSRMRVQGDLVVVTYPVADLVVPIPDPSNQVMDPFNGVNSGVSSNGQMSVPPQGFGQIAQNQTGSFDPANPGRRQPANAMDPDFSALSDLIVATIAPDSWDQIGGPASIKTHETTLSLVIRQTQKIHEEITDLLDQLRRLQDLQVTIEVRFVTVSDRFFERIGIDFNFNMAPTTGYPNVDNSGLPLQKFGSVNLPQFGLTGSTNQQGQNQQGQQQGGQQQGGQQQQGQQGQQSQQQTGGAQSGFFGAGPTLNLYNNPSNPSIVGMKNSTNFTQDLSVPFHQGSFAVGVPTFGNYNPQAGMEMGMAILSDIEAFFFIQAAQGDQRNNLMFAPKVTVFNGQTGTVTDSKARPFVTSLIPTVGFASTGFQPVITTVNEGISLSVTAVVSSDRRFVRLSVNPLFSSITDVFTFSFVGGGGAGQQGQQGQQGQNQQGGQGGFGGGQFGGGGGQQGFGIGGGFGGGGGGGFGGGGGGGFGGGQNGNNNNRNGGGQTITVQQPVVERVTVLTTVSVPDGGTILLGGIKRLKEGRNMSGVPILNKIPYVSRLFKNTGVGRETESLMLMITPRIIIQEEEEELLGLPRT
ncbi:MAG: hypothetical protein JSS49_00610 [Planctomycetes bacterium]|nr:hypothetical protein [Planctomycetota bacterium]